MLNNRPWQEEEDVETTYAIVDRFETEVVRFRRSRLHRHCLDRQEGFVGQFDFSARFRIHRNQEIVVSPTSPRSSKFHESNIIQTFIIKLGMIKACSENIIYEIAFCTISLGKCRAFELFRI